MVDGVGHIGGGIGVLLIAPLIPKMTVFEAFMVISAFLVAAAVVAQLSLRTRGRRFEELSQ
jgi:MFS transporter, putative metabolite:H+ symporter